MGKKGFKDVNMLVLGGGLVLVVLFFLGAFAVKEAFELTYTPGMTISTVKGYLSGVNENNITSLGIAKSNINTILVDKCRTYAGAGYGNGVSGSANLGNITYSESGVVAGSKNAKINVTGTATCNWTPI